MPAGSLNSGASPGAGDEGGAGTQFRVDHLELVVVSVGDVELSIHQDNPEGVLQTDRRSDSVAVAKIEQTRPDQGSHSAGGLKGESPHAADLAVGHIEGRPIAGQTAGLREAARQVGAVHNVLHAIAGNGGDHLPGQVQRPDLVMAGHGDKQEVVLHEQSPGTVQADAERRSAEAQAVLKARAGHRRDGLPLQVQGTDHVVLAVGHVERIALQGQALRVGETRLLERTVYPARPARAGDGNFLAGQVSDDNTVVGAVGDEQSAALGVSKHLAGEVQGAMALPGRSFQLKRQRLLVQRPAGAMSADQLADGSVEGSEDLLVSDLANQETFGIHQEDGRPGLHAVAVPDFPFGVVEDRVVNLIAVHGLADVGWIFLAVELRRVDADDDQLIGILLFQPDQVGYLVDAVNSTQGPEVEDDDLAAQVLELNRGPGANPARAAVQLRRDDALGRLCGQRRRQAAPKENPKDANQQGSAQGGKRGQHRPSPLPGATTVVIDLTFFFQDS